MSMLIETNKPTQNAASDSVMAEFSELVEGTIPFVELLDTALQPDLEEKEPLKETLPEVILLEDMSGKKTPKEKVKNSEKRLLEQPFNTKKVIYPIVLQEASIKSCDKNTLEISLKTSLEFQVEEQIIDLKAAPTPIQPLDMQTDQKRKEVEGKEEKVGEVGEEISKVIPLKIQKNEFAKQVTLEVEETSPEKLQTEFKLEPKLESTTDAALKEKPKQREVAKVSEKQTIEVREEIPLKKIISKREIKAEILAPKMTPDLLAANDQKRDQQTGQQKENAPELKLVSSNIAAPKNTQQEFKLITPKDLMPKQPYQQKPAFEQISIRLQKAVKLGEQTLYLKLKPSEKIEVEASLKFKEDGSIKIHIQTKDPTVFKELQNNQLKLETTLNNHTNLDKNNTQIEFSLKEDSTTNSSDKENSQQGTEEQSKKQKNKSLLDEKVGEELPLAEETGELNLQLNLLA